MSDLTTKSTVLAVFEIIVKRLQWGQKVRELNW